MKDTFKALAEKFGKQSIKKITPPDKKRRLFLHTVVLFFGVVGTSLATLFKVARLRPPGAITEDKFLASCIKCGQCVQICPVNAIRLADLADGKGVGAPYIDARAQACDFSCGAVQCIVACPTGSLSHTVTKKEEVRMGLARVAKPHACLASMGQGFEGQARGHDFQGLLCYKEIDCCEPTIVKNQHDKVSRCEPIAVREQHYNVELCNLCVSHCPIKDENGKPTAISLQPIDGDKKRQFPVIHETCVGCGVCEMICPVEPSVIVIDERKTWGAA